jgi:hypothetical protein
MAAGIALFKKDAWARKALPWFVGLCLVAGALGFLGCDSDGGGGGGEETPILESNSPLIGKWSGNGDEYIITATTLSYGYSGSIGYAGTIRYVSKFSDTAGVIIIEYDDDKRQKYYEYDENWNPVGDPSYGPGKFHATYYENLTSSSIKLAGVYKSGGAEQATLEKAKQEFTMGNKGTYVSSYGTYTKQP